MDSATRSQLELLNAHIAAGERRIAVLRHLSRQPGPRASRALIRVTLGNFRHTLALLRAHRDILRKLLRNRNEDSSAAVSLRHRTSRRLAQAAAHVPEKHQRAGHTHTVQR